MFDELTSWDNLLLAYRKASKGKRGHANVAGFDHRLEDNLLLLQAELQTRAYRPGPYNSFHIHEPKRRLISAISQIEAPKGAILSTKIADDGQ